MLARRRADTTTTLLPPPLAERTINLATKHRSCRPPTKEPLWRQPISRDCRSGPLLARIDRPRRAGASGLAGRRPPANEYHYHWILRAGPPPTFQRFACDYIRRARNNKGGGGGGNNKWRSRDGQIDLPRTACDADLLAAN
jgi:hypothetical protein